jgi:hypothetical protein
LLPSYPPTRGALSSHPRTKEESFLASSNQRRACFPSFKRRESLLYIHQYEANLLLGNQFTDQRGAYCTFLSPSSQNQVSSSGSKFFFKFRHTLSINQPITDKLSFILTNQKIFCPKTHWFFFVLSLISFQFFTYTIHFQTGLRYGQFLNVVYKAVGRGDQTTRRVRVRVLARLEKARRDRVSRYLGDQTT